MSSNRKPTLPLMGFRIWYPCAERRTTMKRPPPIFPLQVHLGFFLSSRSFVPSILNFPLRVSSLLLRVWSPAFQDIMEWLAWTTSAILATSVQLFSALQTLENCAIISSVSIDYTASHNEFPCVKENSKYVQKCLRGGGWEILSRKRSQWFWHESMMYLMKYFIIFIRAPLELWQIYNSA